MNDLTGKIFGRLTVINFSRKDKNYNNFWICKCSCGNIKEANAGSLIAEHTRSCGCLQSEIARNILKQKIGEKNYHWKGGRIEQGGYILEKVSSSRPSKYIFEHIKVMENFLGRSLKDYETVHHKNGIKNDNRIDNLELKTHHHETGQSVNDMINFCISYLEEYKPEALKKDIIL